MQAISIEMSQGFILGPILFIIFVNDAPDAVKELIKLYADITLHAISPDLKSLNKWLYTLHTYQDSQVPWLVEDGCLSLMHNVTCT